MTNLIEKERVNKEIVEAYNSMCEDKVDNIDEVLDILSEEFQSNYDQLGDAQDAYDALVDEYNEVMKNHCFVYNLSGDNSWSISTGKRFDSSKFSKYIEIVKEYYCDDNINTLDDILSKLERHVTKTMSNVGCDMFTALNSILEEDLQEFYNKDIFVVDGADEDARIEILY